MNTDKSKPVISGAQLNRLKFIERRLYWIGRFNRRELGERFGISATRQTTDMNKYKELAEGTVAYDRFTKAYHPTGDFRPRLTDPESEDFTADLMAGDLRGAIPESRVVLVSSPLRSVKGPVVRSVMQAMDQGQSLRILYASMSSTEPSWRTISPHAMGSDDQRWHVRAYCHRGNKYKDFVLGRILATGERGQSLGSHEDDRDWHEFVELHIGPDPRLEPGARAAIEADFSMENGRSILQVRKATAWYIIMRWNLAGPAFEDPRRQQVVLLNSDVLPTIHTTKK